MKNSTIKFLIGELFKKEASKVDVNVVMNSSYKNGEEYELEVFLENFDDHIVLKKDIKLIVSDDDIWQDAPKRHVVPFELFKESLNVEFPRNKGFFCNDVTTNKFSYNGIDHRGNTFNETKCIHVLELNSVMLG